MQGLDPDKQGVPVAEHVALQASANATIDDTKMDGVTVFDPTACFVDAAGVCRMEWEGHAVYYDSGHLTVYGALRLRPLLEGAMRALAAPAESQK